MSDFVPFLSIVIVLFALVYFCFASIPFLFVRLDVPEVGRLLRGLFDAYFRIVPVTGLVATAALAASGRMAFTAVMLLLAAGALALRGWTLERIDAQQNACRTGDDTAPGRLRMMHVAGMAANILVIASVCSGVLYIL